MTNHCGSCTACCLVFNVPALDKDAGKWCQHCSVGVGCKIYEQRPTMCQDFSCLYLLSQEEGRPHLPPELRPDRCRIVFSPSTNERVMAGTILPNTPNALDRKGVRQLIESLVGGGMSVVLGTPKSTNRVLINREGAHPIRMTEPDESGMQYNIEEEER